MAEKIKKRRRKSVKPVKLAPVNPYTVIFQRLSAKNQKRLWAIWRALFSWLKLFIPVLLVGLAMIIANFMKHIDGGRLNGDATFFSEFTAPVIAAALVAGLIGLVYLLIFRRNQHAALLAALMAILASSNFDERFHTYLPYIKALFPVNLQTEKYYSLLFLVFQLTVYGLVAVLLVRLISRLKLIANQIYSILLVAAIYIFIATAWPFIGYIRDSGDQRYYQPPALALRPPAKAKQAVKPDIYYIVLDDYTNNSILKDQLGFDNSEFLNGLRAEGFYSDDNAYSAYPFTSMSVGSTMEARYLNNLNKLFGKAKYQTETPYFQSARYSPVVQELKKVGYSYDLIGSWFAVSDKAPLADNFYYQFNSLNLNGKKVDLAEFDGTKMSNSLFAPILKEGLKIPGMNRPLVAYGKQDYVSLVKYQFDSLASLASTPDTGGRFIFTHVLIPHGPYVFNADGSISTNSGLDNVGKTIDQKYLDQVKYINTQIKASISQIIAASGGRAVIILQSDEGIEPDSFLQTAPPVSDMTAWSDSYLQTKYGILAAYLLPGVTTDELLPWANSVNIFRLVLNHYFGYELPLLPNCNFALNQGRGKSFLFSDITSRLSATPDSKCQTIYN